MKDFSSETSKNDFSKKEKKGAHPPTHFDTYSNLDKEGFKYRNFHNMGKPPEEDDNEYHQLNKNRNKNWAVEITSEPLKYEYLQKVNYLNSGSKSIGILLIFLIIDTLLNIKYAGTSGLKIAIIIIAVICMSFIILLVISIRENALLDPYGYVLFYFFSIIESVLLLILYGFKCVGAFYLFEAMNSRSCITKFRCPSYFTYLCLVMLSFLIFCGIIWCIKFTFTLLLDGVCVLICNKKTFFKRQMELNQMKEKDRKIEFEDEKLDNDS